MDHNHAHWMMILSRPTVLHHVKTCAVVNLSDRFVVRAGYQLTTRAVHREIRATTFPKSLNQPILR